MMQSNSNKKNSIIILSITDTNKKNDNSNKKSKIRLIGDDNNGKIEFKPPKKNEISSNNSRIKIIKIINPNDSLPKSDGNIPQTQKQDNKIIEMNKNEKNSKNSSKTIEERNMRRVAGNFRNGKQINVPHTCSICFSEIQVEDLYTIKNCGHTFHLSCIKECLTNDFSCRKIDLKCPSENCNGCSEERELRMILGKDDMIERYFIFKIENFIEKNPTRFFKCPNPTCVFAIFYRENESEFICRFCSKKYCIKCREAWHDNISCLELKLKEKNKAEQKLFEKYVKDAGGKQCSKCKAWIQKTKGCNHMTCRCGYEFCYVCGGIYRGCRCPLFDAPLNEPNNFDFLNFFLRNNDFR